MTFYLLQSERMQQLLRATETASLIIFTLCIFLTIALSFLFPRVQFMGGNPSFMYTYEVIEEF